MQENSSPSRTRSRVGTVVGIVLCVLLIPILLVNCILLVQGWTNPEEVPALAGISPLITLSGSMEEDFPAGSLIFTRRAEASEVQEGDIISYFDPESLSGAVVTHRVRFIRTDETGKTVFYTYGTANVDKEFSEVEEEDCAEIPAQELVGIYTGVHLRGVGRVAVFLQSVPGVVVCLVLPLAAWVGYDLLRRRRVERRRSEDREELIRELEELRRRQAEQEASATDRAADRTDPPSTDTPPTDMPSTDTPPEAQ